MNKPLPKKLKKEPLIEAVFEIRFQGASLLSNLLLGHLMTKFGNMPVQKLPAADIPEQLREHSPTFKYSPIFQLKLDNNFILIGDKMCAVTSSTPYEGWANFKKHILEVAEYLEKCNLLTKIERYSLKYVNLIEAESTAEQLSLIDFDLKLGKEKVKEDAVNMRVDLQRKTFLHAVQIISNSIVEENGNQTKKGILVSIDSIATNLTPDFWKSLAKNLENIHTVNKELFFEFLKDQTIRSLEPIYDNE